jgi:hypothetical protein
MTMRFRDSRIPPQLPPTNRLNTDYEKEMDVHFSHYCTARLRFYLLYILIDLLLITFVFSLRNLWLLFFVLIAIVDILVTCATFLALSFYGNLFSNKKKRVIGVARMVAYDAEHNAQSVNLPPLRRFALLTQLRAMSWWHAASAIHVVLPPLLTVIAVFAYFMIYASDLTFLFAFSLARLLIASHVYYTLVHFYDEAVSASFRKVIKVPMQAEVYGVARSTLLVNSALDRANKYLEAIAKGTYVPPVRKVDKPGPVKKSKTRGVPLVERPPLPAAKVKIGKE